MTCTTSPRKIIANTQEARMPGRRSFLIGCGGLVAAPALAALAANAANAGITQGVPALAGSPMAAALTAMPELEAPALRIVGWESHDDSTDGAWIHINSSWRADWR
jgi:hypothetical protein